MNTQLTAAVQALKQVPQTSVTSTAPVVHSRRSRVFVPPPPARRQPWKLVVAVCAVALVLVIAAGVALILRMNKTERVDADSGAAPAVSEQVKLATAVSPIQPITTQPTTSVRSGSCQYASLDACVNDMAARLGVAPSDTSIRKYGTYSCRQIGCQ